MTPMMDVILTDLSVAALSGFGRPRPMLASTYTAQVVRLYTKARGKYVAKAQHRRSILCAQLRSLRRDAVGGGDEDGEYTGIDGACEGRAHRARCGSGVGVIIEYCMSSAARLSKVDLGRVRGNGNKHQRFGIASNVKDN